MFSYLHQPPGFYKRVFLLSLPVVLQNLITTSLGFMDTFMVGLLGSEEMSAVTVANTPVFIMQLLLFGLQSGSGVLISQYWGKNDRESINRILGIGLYAAGGISVLFALLAFLAPQSVLRLVTDNARLVDLATPYLRIVGLSYVFDALASVYIGMQRSTENTTFGMAVFMTSTAVNTLGNYILIFGKFGAPALGVTGAATATLFARILELIICIVYLSVNRRIPLIAACIFRPGVAILRTFIKYSTPVLINESMWGFGTSMYTVIMGHMVISTDIISAYTVAGGIDRIIVAAEFGLAAAAGVIIGKEVGMGNRESVLGIGKALSFLAFCLGVVICGVEQLLFWTLLQPYLLPLFHLSELSATLCTMLVCCYSAAAPLNSFATDRRRFARRRRRAHVHVYRPAATLVRDDPASGAHSSGTGRSAARRLHCDDLRIAPQASFGTAPSTLRQVGTWRHRRVRESLVCQPPFFLYTPPKKHRQVGMSCCAYSHFCNQIEVLVYSSL